MARRSFLLNDNWIFKGQDGQEIEVTLPHTWNNYDGQDGGNDYYRGKLSYHKTFEKPDYDPEREEVYIEFQGVNSIAEVFLNDTRVGYHEGGYSTFRINISSALREGSNSLVVYADNGKNDRVYPQMADFTFFGGIYRDVKLLIVNKCHFDLENYGNIGVKITPFYEMKPEQVAVKSFLADFPGKENTRIRYSIWDAEGLKVSEEEVCMATAVMPLIYLEGDKGELSWVNFNGTEKVLEVKDYHLWNGLEDPYLYTLRAELFQDSELVDEVSASFGIRSFYVDPEKGFFLNGRSYPLHGVSRHQDFKNTGTAITRAHHDRDMELIREVGANTIRLAHYQHDQYFYELCDKYGMIVWAEIPYISAHLKHGNENAEEQMRELIIQNYHHPSIVTWGISNEITISPVHKKEMLENHLFLNNLVHEMDPGRPTTMACFAMCNPFRKVVHVTDLVGYNLYLGWYVPGFWLNNLFIRCFHFVYPKTPLGFSEYGAEGMPNLHSRRPVRGDHTEEYQAKYHEYMVKCLAKYPFMWANHIWNMFDFAADARFQGGEPGMNHKGLISYDRQTKKDSFFLYKCYWNPEPMVHITSKRFEERKKYKIEIKVYSNCKEVALYKDGELIEKKTGDKVFKFKTLLSDGENRFKAVAVTEAGEEIVDEAHFLRTDKPKHYGLIFNKAKSNNWM